MTSVITTSEGRFLVQNGHAIPIIEQAASAKTPSQTEAIIAFIAERGGRVSRDEAADEIARVHGWSPAAVIQSARILANRGKLVIHPLGSKGPQDWTLNAHQRNGESATTFKPPIKVSSRVGMRPAEWLRERLTSTEPVPVGPLLDEFNRLDGRTGMRRVNIAQIRLAEGLVIDREARTVARRG